MQPCSALIQFYWAHILQSHGEQEQSAHHLERFVELFPDHSAACYDLSVYYLQRQRVDDGVGCLR